MPLLIFFIYIIINIYECYYKYFLLCKYLIYYDNFIFGIVEIFKICHNIITKRMSNDNVLVNGPYNTVRIEGSIGNIKKVIYLFFDYHSPVNEQSSCDGYDNTDIANYMYKHIKNITFPLDIFMEIRRTHINEKIPKKRNKYIWEMNKLFKQEFSVKEERVQNSKTNTNVRLHYLDIRDYYSFLDYKYSYIDDLYLHNIEQLHDDLKILNDDMKNWYSSIFGDLDKKETIKSINNLGKAFDNNKLNSIVKMVQKDILKIREKYNNEEVKNGLKYSFSLLKLLFENLFETLKKAIQLVGNANEKIKKSDFDLKKNTLQIILLKYLIKI